MLQIEQNFINAQKDVLNITEYNRIARSIDRATKTRFYKSLELGAIIAKGLETFKSDGFKQEMDANGITWSVEDFIKNAYGIQKSFAYKVVKAASHEQRLLEAFEQFVESNDKSLTIEEFNKFVKNLGKVSDEATAEEIAEEASEEIAEETSTRTLFTFVSKAEGMECNVNVNDDGSFNTSSSKEDLLRALDVLKIAITTQL